MAYIHQTLYVLHSPYPDKSWRGLEKCVTTAFSDAPLFFLSSDDAERFAAENTCEGFIVVPLRVLVPSVRQALST